MEIIILGIVILVLFVITWIVIGVNATPFCPIPLDIERGSYKSFRDSWEYTQMKSDISSLNARIVDIQMNQRFMDKGMIFETPETTISKASSEKLLKELEKRGKVTSGKIVS